MTIHHGDCIQVMRDMPEASIDAIVTDPPYGLGFMGKAWDDLPPGEEWARECLRVLKPGGHMLAFGGTRTWHRLAVAIEDAGFEIRDSIAWLYGSGFPKSLDVAKAINATERHGGANSERLRRANLGDKYTATGIQGNRDGLGAWSGDKNIEVDLTENARKWQGFGTSLKPSHEPIVVARKPLCGTVAANVLAHGTGALNIDATRIGTDEDTSRKRSVVSADSSAGFGIGIAMGGNGSPLGRWPANVALDADMAAALDAQSGVLKSGALKPYKERHENASSYSLARDSGASRFFYCAKAPAKERPKVDGVAHPTVKPLALMRWLIRLVTPPGGTVLDPFAGSGTTVEAAILEGLSVIGIEREAEYLPLINMRVARAKETPPPVEPPTLFGDAS